MQISVLPKSSILITGATGGIGKAICRKLIARYSGSYQFILCGYSREKLQHLLDELSSIYSSTDSISLCGIAMDLLDSDSTKQLFDQMRKSTALLFPSTHQSTDEFSCLPIEKVVHCAGTLHDAMLMMTRDDDIQAQLQLHVVQSLKLIQYASKMMLRRKIGQVLLFSSVVAQQGSEGQIVYAAAKAAVEGIVKSAAKELGMHNIRVNAIAPGVVETDMTAHYDDIKKQALAQRTAIRRLGTVDDIASVADFLLSDAASYITGQIIAVDGGMSL